MPSQKRWAGSVGQAGEGAEWQDAQAALGASGSGATAALDQFVSGQHVSRLLVLTGFGFDLPAGATVTGFTLRLVCGSNAGSAYTRFVSLAADGVPVEEGMTFGSQWPTEAGLSEYHGGSSVLWRNAPWTAAEVNAAGFGVAVGAGVGEAPDLATFRGVEVEAHWE